MQPPTAGQDAARRSESIPLWPVGVAVAVRLAIWTLVPSSRLASDEDGYVPAGLALLASGTRDLFWPPVTGWIVAGVAWAVGEIRWIRLAWIAMDIGCVFAIRTLATRFAPLVTGADPARTSRFVTLATLAYALYLPAISFSQFATSEIPALLQTLLIVVLVTHPRPAYSRSITAGLLAGTLILTRPSLLPVVVCIPAALALPSHHGLLRWPRGVWLRHTALMLGLAATVVAGLAVTNWRQSGELTIAQNSAYNLYIGNRELYAEDLNLFSPRATAEQIEFRRQYFSGTLPPPAGRPADLQREAVAAIVARPGLFLRRAVGRLARVFVPKTDVLELVGGEQRAGIFAPVSLGVLAIANLQWTAVLFGGLAGLAWWWRTDRTVAAILSSVVIGSLPLCLIAISKPRYAFPFEPILILCAVSVALAPPPRFDRLQRRDRWIVGMSLAFILWGWAAWLIFAVTSRLALAAA
jgi:hypothetical protein